MSTQKNTEFAQKCVDKLNGWLYYVYINTNACVRRHGATKGGDPMLTKNEQKTIKRLAAAMQNMDDMQKAQLCAFTEGLAMALERKGA